MQRLTSYFGVPLNNDDDNHNNGGAVGITKGSRTVAIMNSNANPGLTSSLTRGNLANMIINSG